MKNRGFNVTFYSCFHLLKTQKKGARERQTGGTLSKGIVSDVSTKYLQQKIINNLTYRVIYDIQGDELYMAVSFSHLV